MQQSIDTFFSRAKVRLNCSNFNSLLLTVLKKTDESQSESQSTPTKVSDTISPNKRKHEGDEEESPKRRKIEKTPEKVRSPSAATRPRDIYLVSNASIFI